MFQVPQKISKSVTHQAVRQCGAGRQEARDRQQDPEPKTVTCGELVGTRAQSFLGASVSTTKTNYDSRQSWQLDPVHSQAGWVPQKPEGCGQKLWGEGKRSMAAATKQKQTRNTLQMENAAALRQSPVDFGS